MADHIRLIRTDLIRHEVSMLQESEQDIFQEAQNKKAT